MQSRLLLVWVGLGGSHPAHICHNGKCDAMMKQADLDIAHLRRLHACSFRSHVRLWPSPARGPVEGWV